MSVRRKCVRRARGNELHSIVLEHSGCTMDRVWCLAGVQSTNTLLLEALNKFDISIANYVARLQLAGASTMEKITPTLFSRSMPRHNKLM